ncbi:MAG: FlgD immunoglobulin-like domain containing protein [Candidatus Eisenbacteria bacterium]
MNCDPLSRVLICIAVIAALAGGSAPAVATEANGIPLCTAANDQLRPVTAPDGTGGIVVAWHDNRPAAAAGGVCYAQRVNAAGVPQWSASGVALSTTGDSGLPVIVSDGAGGAFVAYAGNTSQARAQWVNAAGVPQWGADGVQLSTTASSKRDLAIAPDINGAGGAIVAWREVDGTGGTSDVYAQKVSAAGTTQWSASGVPVAVSSMNNETLPALISDGAGGAIIVWRFAAGARVQRLNASGVAQWGTTSLTGTTNNNAPAIVPDGAGGAVISWAGGGIFAQRVSSAGVKEWNGNAGVALATTGTMPTMIPDGSGGATVTWQDFRSGTNFNIYAQRVSSLGAPQWIANGAEVCFVTDDQLSPTIVSDGGTGAIISWFDARSQASGDDIYVARINSSGASQWTPDGMPLCTAANDQEYPTVASDGAGGAFVAWQDRRSGTNYDIYAHHVNPAGAVLAVRPESEASSMVRVWPAPFSDRVRIVFVLPAATRVRMDVVDVGGRMVRALGTALLAAGANEFTWDGRTNDGRQAGDGVYFLRVNGQGIAFSRSVVRLN